jgi:hypothetical protein
MRMKNCPDNRPLAYGKIGNETSDQTIRAQGQPGKPTSARKSDKIRHLRHPFNSLKREKSGNKGKASTKY